ncbi:hypothetical protein ACWGI8_00525 [Streptomyces sp. NPDC054841]
MSSRSALTSLRRLLRQDSSDTWAVRLLPRIVFGLALAYTLFVLASAGMSSFIAVCTMLALAVTGWLLRRRGQLLLGLVSTVITAAVTGGLAAAGDIARGTAASGFLSGQAVFGYWALSGMALLGAWMGKEHPGRRGVTVVIADVVLVTISSVGTVVPSASVPLGFLGVVAVLAARGGGIAAVRRRMRQVSRPGRRSLPATDSDG